MAVMLSAVACSAPPLPPASPQAAPPEPALASSPTPVASPTPAAAPAARKLAALRFDIAGDDFPSPLVDVLVSGQPTTMIVDTGATHSVVASWVANEIGPTSASSVSGVDHTGKALALSKLPGAALSVSGWGALEAADLFVVTVPPALQRRGIGGVLSPQALAAEGRAVVLDLRKRSMRDVALADAARVLADEPGVTFSGEVRSCGKGNGALPFVRATIAGVEVDAQLDTGATHSTVRAASEAGGRLRPLAARSSTAVAASGSFTIPTVDDAHVKIGGLEADTTIDIVAREPIPVCGNDAMLGMDVLRRCVLVLGGGALTAKCGAP